MKRKGLLITFAIVLVLELASLYFQWDNIHSITKLLLLPILLVFSALQTLQPSSLKLPLLTALLFSWIGDAFLLFDSAGSLNFIFGLLSFLTAHIAYGYLFLRIRKADNRANWNLLFIAGTIVYSISLLYTLYPGLGSLLIPVILYATVLSAMFVWAAHTLPLTSANGRLLTLSAALFVLSDSLLAINKFHSPLPLASVGIMATYALAQLGIVYAVITHAVSPNKP